ncbi:MAG: ATP-binding protein, partial [Desulfurococcales archaeon]|nr:ATP-binding protein [Desulfurococcales archaeon]
LGSVAARVWWRILPRVGVDPGALAGILAQAPWFILETWRLGGRLRLYLSGQVAEATLRRAVGVRREDPPGIPGGFYRAELRQRPGEFWEPIEARGFQDVYEWIPEGHAVQVAAWRDPKASRELQRKARELRGHRGLAAQAAATLMDLVDEALGQDPLRRERMRRMRSSPGEEEVRRRRAREALERLREGPIYIVRIRVYGPRKGSVRELAELLAAKFTRPLEVEGAGPLSRPLGRAARSARAIPGPAGILGGPSRALLWMNARELGGLLVLPDPSLHPVDFERGAPLPRLIPPRRDIRLGVLEDGREFRVDVEDLYRHAYVIGKTGAGKSTLLLNLALRLWSTGRAAVFVVDPHGDLARDVVEAAPSLERVYYLDAGSRDFAVNPLDLPGLGDPELARSIAVDNTVAVLEKVLKLPETAVNVKFIVRTLLYAMYRSGATPTFEDLYRAILALRAGTLDLDVDDPEWRVQVELLRKLPEQSIASSLVRLQPFHTHPLLRELTRTTTLPIERLVRERALVAIAVPKALGEEFSELLTSLIVMKLWFYVLERALRGGGRDPIFVIVDEFQNVSGLPVIETILSEARKYGLHIIAAHQHLKQLPPELLQSLLANTALKVVFSVEGGDVDRLAKIDRSFAREVAEALTSLAVGSALVRLQARPGEQPWPPVVVRTDPPPPRLRGLAEARAGMPRFTPPPAGARSPEELLNPVLALLPPPGERLTPEEQLVLYRVWRASRGGGAAVEWSRVLAGLGLRRQRAEEARDALAARGLIEAWKEGNRWLVRYRRGLLAGLKAVAPSREGRRLAAKALLYYLERGYYASPARQSGPSRPDLIAIPYDRSQLRPRYREAVAVEVESCGELEAHPEQAARNLVKNWELARRGVVAAIHFWAPETCAARLREILERAARENGIPQDAYEVHPAKTKPKPTPTQTHTSHPGPEPTKPQAEAEAQLEIQGHKITLTKQAYKQLRKLQAQGYKITAYNPQTREITLQKPGKPPKQIKP